mmetsp:Transcript_12902/g.41218  ORF Transcript_12902/g.41218 Transcript_12902/m.41218 type:complete len:244 (+) Transcript_12902:84-815(+)
MCGSPASSCMCPCVGSVSLDPRPLRLALSACRRRRWCARVSPLCASIPLPAACALRSARSMTIAQTRGSSNPVSNFEQTTISALRRGSLKAASTSSAQLTERSVSPPGSEPEKEQRIRMPPAPPSRRISVTNRAHAARERVTSIAFPSNPRRCASSSAAPTKTSAARALAENAASSRRSSAVVRAPSPPALLASPPPARLAPSPLAGLVPACGGTASSTTGLAVVYCERTSTQTPSSSARLRG